MVYFCFCRGANFLICILHIHDHDIDAEGDLKKKLAPAHLNMEQGHVLYWIIGAYEIRCDNNGTWQGV